MSDAGASLQLARPLRTGVVDFLNAMPLWHALRDDPRFELVPAAPSVLAAMLQRGELDLGLLPVIEHFRGAATRLVPGIGVSARGWVDSVMLFHRGGVESVRHITLDTASRTSVTLVRVLCAQLWQLQDVTFSDGHASERDLSSMEAGQGYVLIGDSALKHAQTYPHTDLAQAWLELTGLPFVFAGWLVREELAGELGASASALVAALHSALDQGLAQRSEIARTHSAERNLDPELVDAYLHQRIHYHLDDDAMAGLARFAENARELWRCERSEIRLLGY